MEIAVEQVFANVLICKDLGIAQRVADTFAIDCVTFEGDLVSYPSLKYPSFYFEIVSRDLCGFLFVHL